MQKTLFAFALLTLLGAPALTAPALAGHGGKHVVVGLNGLVCDYCAQSMKKIFGKKDAVSDVHVDLSAKTMTLDLKPAADLSDTDINKGVLDAGYTVTGITRD